MGERHGTKVPLTAASSAFILGLVLCPSTARAAGERWEQLSTNIVGPEALWGSVAVYDSGRHRVLATAGTSALDWSGFEGRTGTWELDLSPGLEEWRLLTRGGPYPPMGILARDVEVHAASAFDSLRKRWVVIAARQQKVWVLDAASEPAAWRELTTIMHWQTPSGLSLVPEAVAIYDEAGDRIVYHGPWSPGAKVWTLYVDKNTQGEEVYVWRSLTPSGAGPFDGLRESHAICDRANNRMILFGGADQSWRATNQVWALSLSPGSENWSELFPAGAAPAPRAENAAAYDAAGRRMIVFGSANSLNAEGPGEVWSLDLDAGSEAWSLVTPAGLERPPSSQFEHQLAYDPQGRRMILFGGNLLGRGARTGMWELSLVRGSEAWTPNFHPSREVPRPRFRPGMALDPGRHRILLMGGDNDTSAMNDLWELRLDRELLGDRSRRMWRRILPAGTPPPPRVGHSTIYDTANDRLIIFGGANGWRETVIYGDVWAVKVTPGAEVWTEIAGAGAGPGPLRGHTAVYDAPNERLVTFGGSASGAGTNDVWALSTVAGREVWAKLDPAAPGGAPVPRSWSSSIFDPAGRRMLVYGGRNQPAGNATTGLGDLWALSLVKDQESWTALTPLGGPAYAEEPVATYDALAGRMLITGITYWSVGNFLPVTWGLSLHAGAERWERLADPQPAADFPRFGHALVFERALARMLLFGGCMRATACFPRNDLWALDVAPPARLSVAPLSIALEAPARIGRAEARVRVENASHALSPSFRWWADPSASWLSASPDEGDLDGASALEVTVTAEATGRAGGTYQGAVVFQAPTAQGAPQTVVVSLSLWQPALVSTEVFSEAWALLADGSHVTGGAVRLAATASHERDLATRVVAELRQGADAQARAASDFQLPGTPLEAWLELPRVAGTYRVVAWAEDVEGATSEATDVLALTVDEPSGAAPAPPVGLAQRDPVTGQAIALGGRASSPAVLLRARPSHTEDVALRAYFEVTLAGGAPQLFRSEPVRPLQWAQVSVNLPPGGYSWRVRAVDERGVVGEWVQFADAPHDFEVPEGAVVRAVEPGAVLVGSRAALDVSGEGFSGVDEVWLGRRGVPTLRARSVSVQGDSALDAEFDFDLPGGAWDLILKRGGAVVGARAGAVKVLTVKVDSVSPDGVPRRGPFTLQVRGTGLELVRSATLRRGSASRTAREVRAIASQLAELEFDLGGVPGGVYELELLGDGWTLRAGDLLVRGTGRVVRSAPRTMPTFFFRGTLEAEVEGLDLDPLPRIRLELGATEIEGSDILVSGRIVTATFSWSSAEGIAGDYDLVVTDHEAEEARAAAAVLLSPLLVVGVFPASFSVDDPNGSNKVVAVGLADGARVELHGQRTGQKRTLAGRLGDAGRSLSFSPGSLPPDWWDVHVVNPDGARVIVPGLAAGGPVVPVGWGRGILRYGREGTSLVEIRNYGLLPAQVLLKFTIGYGQFVGGPPTPVGAVLAPGESLLIPLAVRAPPISELPDEAFLSFSPRTEDGGHGAIGRAADLRVRAFPNLDPAVARARAEAAANDLRAAVEEFQRLVVGERKPMRDTVVVADYLGVDTALGVANYAVSMVSAGMEVAIVSANGTSSDQAAAWAAFINTGVTGAVEVLSDTAADVAAIAGNTGSAIYATAKLVQGFANGDQGQQMNALLNLSSSVAGIAGTVAGANLGEDIVGIAGGIGDIADQWDDYWSLYCRAPPYPPWCDPPPPSTGGGVPSPYDTTPNSPYTAVATSYDPNDKTALHGSTVTGGELRYLLRFENKYRSDVDEALQMPALQVVVEDQLDGALDASSFRPLATSHDRALASATVSETGKVRWVFEEINLPPNKNPPEGEGWILFSVNVRPEVASGTEVKNFARIWFDPEENPAHLDTNAVSTLVDKQAPTVRIASAEALEGRVRITVAATDDASSVAGITVHAARGDDPPFPVATLLPEAGTDVVTYDLAAEGGSTVRLYARAKDRAGNLSVYTDVVTVELPLPAPTQPAAGGPGPTPAQEPEGCGCAAGVPAWPSLWLLLVAWLAGRAALARTRHWHAAVSRLSR